jgi:hypothetical protein
VHQSYPTADTYPDPLFTLEGPDLFLLFASVSFGLGADDMILLGLLNDICCSLCSSCVLPLNLHRSARVRAFLCDGSWLAPQVVKHQLSLQHTRMCYLTHAHDQSEIGMDVGMSSPSLPFALAFDGHVARTNRAPHSACSPGLALWPN